MFDEDTRQERPPFDRLQLAVVAGTVSLVLLWFTVIGPWLFPKPANPPYQPPTTETTAGPPAQQATGQQPETAGPAEQAPTTDELEPPELPPETLVAGEFEVQASNRGAAIRRLALRNYHFRKDSEEPLPIIGALANAAAGQPYAAFTMRLSDDTDFTHWNWEKTALEAGGGHARLEYRALRNGWQARRFYQFPQGGFVFKVGTSLKNTTAGTRRVRIEMLSLPGILGDEPPSRYFGIGAAFAGRSEAAGELMRVKFSASRPPKKPEDAYLSTAFNEWQALVAHYFALAVLPIENAQVASFYLSPLVPDRGIAGQPRFQAPNLLLFLRSLEYELAGGQEVALNLEVFAGPRWEKELARVSAAPDGRDRQLQLISEYGFMKVFGPLCRLLLAVLNFFAAVIPSYGVAIFLLTLLVKLLLFPLQKRGMTGMQKMQALAPRINAIRKKYEHDRSSEGMRRMNLEMMELYRKYGISPLGGCLPMLFQLPMFLALYGTLSGAFELRQRGFLWVRDLTQPDVLFNLGFQIPLLKWQTFNLLPIIYMLLIVAQQWLQPKLSDPQQEQQRRMMSIMFLFFFVIFYNMPAGLVLYFVFNNVLTIIEQQFIKKSLAKDPVMLAIRGDAAGAGAGASRPTAWDREAQRIEKDKRRAEERRKRRQSRLF